jgi:hypothetical protein
MDNSFGDLLKSTMITGEAAHRKRTKTPQLSVTV